MANSAPDGDSVDCRFEHLEPDESSFRAPRTAPIKRARVRPITLVTVQEPYTYMAALMQISTPEHAPAPGQTEGQIPARGSRRARDPRNGSNSDSSTSSRGIANCSNGICPPDRHALFQEFSPLVKRLLNQYGSDVESRRDLVGEIYWRFCRIVDAYDPNRGVPFRAYIVRQLTASTHTHARTKWRRSGREVRLESCEGLRTFEPALDPTPQWDHELVTAQFRSAIPAAIRELPARQRQVLVWRYYEDRSFEEIARMLEVQPATARSLLRHALNRMRAWVHENGVTFD